jgi:hypothetical protein
MSQAPLTDTEAGAGKRSAEPFRGWFPRLTSVLFIIFCLELGLFLLIYPWTQGWTENYFAWALPGSVEAPWNKFWNNGFVRGALSGLGAVDLWIAMAEVFRMFGRRRG